MLTKKSFQICLNIFNAILFNSVFPAGIAKAKDHMSISGETHNSLPIFEKTLFVKIMPTEKALKSLNVSFSMNSKGNGFSEALFVIYNSPVGSPCPQNGQKFSSYQEMNAKYPNLKPIARTILKAPTGIKTAKSQLNITFPEPIQVGQCLVTQTDGGMLAANANLTMDFSLKVILVNTNQRKTELLSLDDEFCFDRIGGCQLSTAQRMPTYAFKNVIFINKSGRLVSIFGNLSNSPITYIRSISYWEVNHLFYFEQQCKATPGISGPDNYFDYIPNDAIILNNLQFRTKRQIALQKSLNVKTNSIKVTHGDCLIHIVRLNSPAPVGGIDAETQLMALITD